MSIYSSPPPARAFHDDKATLLVCWWCTIFAAVIILFRVCGRYIRTERLFREDWLAFACLIPLFARMAVVHVVLLFGTNNAITTGFSDEDIHRRSIGSRLVLVSRIFYAATLWMLKLTISEFFKRLTLNIWTRSHEMMLNFIRWFLLITFIGVFIADISECHPFTHYYQVVPDPGAKCRQGYAQLLTMGTVNVITDLLLVAFPIPIIIRSRMGLKRKIQLVLLFAGSLLPAGTTLYRIPNIIDRHGSQQYRSLLASIEILFAVAVANALILGSFVRDRGVKKQRWKFGSTSDSIERTTSRRGTVIRHWGSDEDLVRDLGISVDPELRDPEALQARPAPMAVAGNVPVKAHKIMGRDWQFPGERSDTSDEIVLMKIGEAHSPADASSVITPRRVSFFDVGGLLDEDQPRRQSSTRTMDTDGESSGFGALHSINSNDTGPGLSPPPARRGSSAFLQDVGGLLGGPKSKKGQPYRGYELQTILQEERSPNLGPVPISRQQTTHSLQDVGGLLSK
ncbi:related to integral membrane protein PTH11 [Phialocephala subalpina]|uniref:Related to integral membrane protein PTH11 n=1 Tax=Phialocephala subalpina TaxID=576137 RepID=A0A1L7XPX5_9HELO|nr:related to integral membrane protein PTH11 [Phialocephala subalpina]